MGKVGLSGKYHTYPEYKDSGVEWLGEIPSHWKVIQSRRLFQQRKERARVQDEQLTASQKYGIISQKKFMEIENQRVVQVITGSEILKHIEPNDFVISMRSFQGGLEWCTQRGCVSSAYVGLIPIKHVKPEFFKYLFKCESYIQALQSTSNLVRDGQALRFDNFSQVWLQIVPDTEQQKIANFLDYETAKIDTLIEKQQQLIKLLKEKRQAVISHAVTKGLPSTTGANVPMRDSGVEWLGEVPEHWDIWKFSHFSPIVTCGIASTPTYVEQNEGMPFLSAQNIQDNKLSLHKYNYISHELHNQLTQYRKPERGDLLVTRVGAGIGAACVIDIDMEFSIYVSLTHIRVNPEIANNKFIMYFFGSDYCHYLNYQGTVTGGGVGNLNVQNVIKYQVPMPSIDEQNKIVDYLEVESNKFNSLIQSVTKSIELAIERRTALISAAVTGKIDVRDWVAPEPSNNTMDSRLRGNDAVLKKDADLNKESSL